MATVLEELVGEFRDFERRGGIANFGTRIPLSEGFPIPQDIRTEIEMQLGAMLPKLKTHSIIQSFSSFLETYRQLAQITERFADIQHEFMQNLDATAAYLLRIPERILQAQRPAVVAQLRQHCGALVGRYRDHQRQLRCDTSLPIIQERRKDLDIILDQYEQLQSIGKCIAFPIKQRCIEAYRERNARVRHIHASEFLPLADAYRDGRWDMEEDISAMRRSALSIAAEYGRGFFIVFPEYVAEARQFADELALHVAHFDAMQQWAQRLRDGSALVRSCPAELQQLRYLAPLLVEARKREREADVFPPSKIIPQTPKPFSVSLLPPPSGAQAAFRLCYDHLSMPIGWQERLERCDAALRKLDTEGFNRADLLYSTALQQYLTSLPLSETFSNFRTQFPALDRAYAAVLTHLAAAA